MCEMWHVRATYVPDMRFIFSAFWPSLFSSRFVELDDRGRRFAVSPAVRTIIRSMAGGCDCQRWQERIGGLACARSIQRSRAYQFFRDQIRSTVATALVPLGIRHRDKCRLGEAGGGAGWKDPRALCVAR